MSKAVTITRMNWHEYVQVFTVTEFRGKQVYKTKSLGYALRSRPKRSYEVYSPLSTSLLKGGLIFLLPEGT